MATKDVKEIARNYVHRSPIEMDLSVCDPFLTKDFGQVHTRSPISRGAEWIESRTITAERTNTNVL